MSTSLIDDTSPESVIGKKGKSSPGKMSYILLYDHYKMIWVLKKTYLSCWCFFCFFLVSSASKVPARLCHPTARQASVSTETALYREGGSHQCPPLCTSIETDLQVFGMLSIETICIGSFMMPCVNERIKPLKLMTDL